MNLPISEKELKTEIDRIIEKCAKEYTVPIEKLYSEDCYSEESFTLDEIGGPFVNLFKLNENLLYLEENINKNDESDVLKTIKFLLYRDHVYDIDEAINIVLDHKVVLCKDYGKEEYIKDVFLNEIFSDLSITHIPEIILQNLDYMGIWNDLIENDVIDEYDCNIYELNC